MKLESKFDCMKVAEKKKHNPMYLFVVYFFICSCHLSKHISLCELFWYPSPDDGYWNRNVNVDIIS